LLIEKAGNRSRVVAEGRQINGITVKEITKERVVLSQNNDTEELVLKVNTAPAGASVGGGMLRGGAAPAVPPTGR